MNARGGPFEDRRAKEGVSADSADEMKDTTGVNPWYPSLYKLDLAEFFFDFLLDAGDKAFPLFEQTPGLSWWMLRHGVSGKDGQSYR